MKPHLHQVLLGGGLAIFLAFTSLFVASLTTPPPYWEEDKMVISDIKAWDMSSGLSMSASLKNQETEILYFDTGATNVTSVLGESDDFTQVCEPSPCEGTYSFSGILVPFYEQNVTQTGFHRDLLAGNWRGYISVYKVGSVQLSLENYPFADIASSLIEEYQNIGNLTKVTEGEFNNLFGESIHVGSQILDIIQVFAGGSSFYISLVDNLLFIRISFISSYYGDDHLAVFEKADIPEEFYIGTLDEGKSNLLFT